MVTYDSEIIVEFAEKLYHEAESIVARYAVIGILLGGSLGAVIGRSTQSAAIMFGLIGAILFGAVALLAGQQKAFALRLQAQIALCQVAIEANTRTTNRGSSE